MRKAIKNWQYYRCDKRPVSNDEVSLLKNCGDSIAVIYNGCSVIGALKAKAIESQALNHSERVVLRGILSPLGEKGIRELHQILRHCDNYSAIITKKMTAKRPGINIRPMGCRRIKEILSTLCSAIDCNCKFRPKKSAYANPLRHISASGNENKHSVEKKYTSRKYTDKKINEHSIAPKQNVPGHLPSTPISDEHIPADLMLCMKQFHHLREQLLGIQETLKDNLQDDGTLPLEFGTIKNDGPDQEILNWIISL